MVSKNELEQIGILIDQRARAIVGIALKRLETLQTEKLDSNKQKSLYKSLLKEIIYEQSRILKEIINASFTSIKVREPKG